MDFATLNLSLICLIWILKILFKVFIIYIFDLVWWMQLLIFLLIEFVIPKLSQLYFCIPVCIKAFWYTKEFNSLINWKKILSFHVIDLKNTYMRLTCWISSVAAVMFVGKMSLESTISVDLPHPRLFIKSK